MRSLCCVLVFFGVVLGCGGTTKEPVASAEAGQSSSGGLDSGGSSASGGSGGAAESGAAAGGSASSSGASSAGSGEGGAVAFVDCDVRKVTCKRSTPECGTFQVPSVEGSCYGDCVKIDRCACSSADECPDPNQYTCWSKTHCGPYVH